MGGLEAMLETDLKISLCMITKNEEEFLPVALDSVIDLVSEIIVVDTGSTDRTIDIARSYGAKVFRMVWQEDFSLARNESLKHASGDWILYLDADERIDAENKQKIKKLIHLDEIMAINVRLVIPQSQRDIITGFYYDYSRLFRNLPHIRFEGRIHEQILSSILRQGGKVYKSDIVIDHWGFGFQRDRREIRIQQNLQLLKQELEKSPHDPFLLYNIGDTYRKLGNSDLAIEHFERIFQLNPLALKKELLSNVHVFLAQLYLLKDNYEQAQKNSLRSIELMPDQVLPYYILATIDFQKGNLEKAKRRLNYLLSLIYNSNANSVLSEMNVSQIYLDLGNCSYRQQNLKQAESFYQKAATYNPHSVEITFNLGKCYQQMADIKMARKWFERTLQLNPSFEAARVNLLKCFQEVTAFEQTSG